MNTNHNAVYVDKRPLKNDVLMNTQEFREGSVKDLVCLKVTFTKKTINMSSIKPGNKKDHQKMRIRAFPVSNVCHGETVLESFKSTFPIVPFDQCS